MSKVQNVSRITPPKAGTASIDIPIFSDEIPKRSWFGLLRPKLVEKAVLIADVIFIVAAGLVSSLGYRLLANGDLAHVVAFAGLGIVVAVNFTAIMIARRNYHLKNLARFARQARDSTVIWSSVYALLAVVGFMMKVSSDFSRGSTILFFVSGLATLLCFRFIVANRISQALANGSFTRRNVIVIAEKGRNASSQSLMELRRCGYYPVRTCEVCGDEILSIGMTKSLRSKLADVIQIAKDQRIEDIYLLFDWQHHRAIDGILAALAVIPVSVHLVPDESAARFLNHPVSNVGGTWTAELRRAPLSATELAAKRFFDLSLATAAVLTLMPLMLITAALIKLDSRGPVLFRQKRNGFNGEAFDIFKFRTMHVLEDGPVIRQATRNDPRVTNLGRWLRKSSIDELPQLFNVIQGNMSLIGPRPHAMSHDSEYEKLIANYAFRHHVKPGLTGWAQINGYRGETPQIQQMERRVEYDLWYINNWSLLLDLKILLKTVVVALLQPTAY
ncbi:MAG: undecaprenyl-phosphate glucose phosphotransferase [Bradyrhizobium sp.]|uniref:undecaprenyl-phosphate glucose phosphotransferase n=1 Tax=Bradyrhizobium sp. TaxID=376 RepID=UPI001C28CB78|nr:undecaprenyl-phosphate glucose phosphotransferase [Bradyrhizobium sp.]MBU6461144.1 undecaprenyl-phosphate glucose phosphotransferase [Pseudomonadota bacterium]MDE2066220.1 undecaprenyl-phosphate glucose phosphotransferase [Bradyrhizobium sp.]MDE2470671.1 undecaprenyl-phosphate glucose phosphotransferase [Bradyrhizobium sp.]